MKLVYFKNREQVDGFISQSKHSQFLQSWGWGEFQEKIGNKVFRIGIEENGKILSISTLIKKALPLGKCYFYCPRGPVINFQFPPQFGGQAISNFKTNPMEIYEIIFKEINKIAIKEKVIFLRFEPTEFKVESFKFKVERTIDVQPSKTLILDLSKAEEELLKNMHQKTRYNIRLAEKKEVKIIVGEEKNFEIFWKIMEETNKRDGFRLHSKNYYKKMLKLGFIKLYLAEYQGKVIAGNIISFYGDTVTYIHGASSNEYRNIMAPYLLQWQAIKLAKKQGYLYYDFYGIDEKKWPGVTRFKKGFGGEEVRYLGTYDLVFNEIWYNIYKLLRKIRRIVNFYG
jgi:peptidoglycan pentaglycine glycine transferase (the first glycine)